jgi:uncharacterized membrane protein required for colicin V production
LAAHPLIHNTKKAKLFLNQETGAKPLQILLIFNKPLVWLFHTLSLITNLLSRGVIGVVGRITGVLLGVHLPSNTLVLSCFEKTWLPNQDKQAESFC